MRRHTQFPSSARPVLAVSQKATSLNTRSMRCRANQNNAAKYRDELTGVGVPIEQATIHAHNLVSAMENVRDAVDKSAVLESIKDRIDNINVSLIEQDAILERQGAKLDMQILELAKISLNGRWLVALLVSTILTSTEVGKTLSDTILAKLLSS